MIPEVICTLFVIFSRIKVQGTYCQTPTNEPSKIIYCEPLFETCCNTGCCPLQTNKSSDLTSFWVFLTIIGIYFTCFGLYICHKKCNSRPIDINITPPMRICNNIENNTIVRHPGLVLSLTTDQEENRQFDICDNQERTPPPSYEDAISVPFHTDNTVPSYDDVMRGK